MSELKLHKRKDISEEYKWNLLDLYENDACWEQELGTLQEDQKTLADFSGLLGRDGGTLYRYLVSMEQVDEKVMKLGSYAQRKQDEDTRDPVYQAMYGKFMAAVVSLSTACSFEASEIMAIDDKILDSFYVSCPELERYRRYLTDCRRRKAHTLSEVEERILTAAGEMSRSPQNIFGAFSDADMVFSDAVDKNGKKYPLTNGSFIALEISPDRVLRKSAYDNLYGRISEFRNTAAALLNAQHKQLKFFAEARHYENSFEAALDRTGVPTSVYMNLIKAVHQNVPRMHRYIRLRKKLLGLNDLHFYDIHTPLVPDFTMDIPFEQAKETVYSALAPLGENYRKVLKEGFENRWIDVYENEGKRGGAYCSGCNPHPYVMLNYNGTLRSQFTLAHEMGHALHTYHSQKYQNPIDANYVIFVAEVASTCNEALLMQYLLEKTKERKERAYLINYFLEQFKSVIYRQTLFAEFELFMGNMVAQGRTLTADILCDEYKRLNRLYYGEGIEIDDSIGVEWARIPHFYYNYYVFQYATGFSAAIAISRKILTEGENAVKDYLNFLSGGCTKAPIDLLKNVGVDMTSPEPVEEALKMFDELMDELEKLVEDKCG